MSDPDFPTLLGEAPRYLPDVIGDLPPEAFFDLDDDTPDSLPPHPWSSSFAGLCEFEALAGDDDGRRYPTGFYRYEWCRRCGCTPGRGCRERRTPPEGCTWAYAYLCSRCERLPHRRRFRRRRLGLNAVRALIAHWRARRLVPLQLGPGEYGRAD